MTRPNAFLIGAPKCGTTSMSEYLRTHPDIFFSDPKEPKFFSDDISTDAHAHRFTEKEYLALFERAGAGTKCVMEGSVRYLRSRVAVPKILAFNPEAKFIVMLRNPADMAQSWHGHQIRMLRENQRDFMTAWRLQKDRATGKNLPAGCKRPDMLQYSDTCRLGSQLERLYSLVPREKVHLIFFDDLVRDPLGAYKTTLDFLNVPYDGRTEFPAVNANRTPRVFWFRYLLRPGFVQWMGRWRRRLLDNKHKQGHGFGITTAITNVLYRTEKRRPLSDEFRRELTAHFEPEVRKLEALTGRDLSAWRTA